MSHPCEVLKFYLLIIIAVLVSSVNSQDFLSESCQRFTPDDCDYQNIIHGYVLPNELECQLRCNDEPKCSLFIFDFRQKYCRLLDMQAQEYFDSCRRIAGPDHPDLNQCQSQTEADECLLIKRAYCTPTGTFL